MNKPVKRRAVQVYMGEVMYKRVDELSDEDDCSMTEWIRRAIKHAITSAVIKRDGRAQDELKTNSRSKEECVTVYYY